MEMQLKPERGSLRLVFKQTNKILVFFLIGLIGFLNSAFAQTPAIPTLSSVTQPTCSTSTGGFTITNYDVGNTYTADPSLNVTISGGLVTAPAGTYTITSTLSGNSATSASVTVNAQPTTPTVPVTSVTQPTCSLGTGTITVTAQGVGDSYSFDGGSTFQSGNSKSGLIAGSYDVMIQSIGGCNSAITTTIIAAQPTTPTAPVTSVTEPTCSLATGTITVTAQGVGESYSFDGGSTFQSGNSKSGLIAGSYDVIIQSSGGCNSSITTTVITAQPTAPTAPVTSVSQPTCSLATGTITVTAQGVGESYSFDGGSTFQSSNSKSGLIAGSYDVMIQSIGGCNSSITTTVIAAQPITPSVNNLSTTICSGGSFSFTPANSTDGIVPVGTTYSWSAPSGTGFTGGAASSGTPTSISGTLVNTTNTTATATYTVTPTSSSCIGNTFTVTITISAKSTINNLSTTICSGGSFSFTPANGTDGIVPASTTYSWSAPSGTGFTGGAASSGTPTSISGPLVNITNSPVNAIYTITPVSGSCSGNSFTITVTVNPTPVPVNDYKFTNATQSVTDNVLTNDGSALSVIQYIINGTTYSAGVTATLSGIGELILDGIGNYTFTPYVGFVGNVPVINYVVKNSTNCTATASLNIAVSTVINAYTESGSAPATGGTAISNVTSNDYVNGVIAVLGVGGNATVKQNGIWPNGITLNTNTGAIAVANNTTPGVYSISYELCDLLTSIHCSIAIDIVTVTAVINPVTESGSALATGGTAIANIASNDFVNGLPAILGSGGNSTVSQNGVWPSGITLNPISGAIVVANGTTPGTYSLSYQQCDLLTPNNCSTISDNVTVTAVINSVTESGSALATGGIAISNVASNDFVNGLPAVLGLGGNSTISQNGIWPSGITLNAISGAIIVANGTTPGTYSISYNLCDLLTLSHCSTMTDVVTITAVINPITESGTIPATGGTAILNIASNDFVNGLLAILGSGGNSTVSQSGVWASGITLNSISGAVDVANGTTPGIYSVSYELCDLLTPSHCSIITDNVAVTAVINLTTESGSLPATGGIAIPNVAGNDFVNGLPAVLGTGGNATVSQSGIWPSGFTLNPTTGAITVSNGVAIGTYSMSYVLCDLLTPSHCSTITDVVNITSLINPVVENGSIQASGGIAIPNIVSNDFVNGLPVVLGTGGNATISQIGVWPSGITLDSSTANINVATGTTQGTYSVTYQLCDLLANCSTVIDVVTVTPIINPVTESGSSLAAGGIAITNVASNDFVNGLPAVLGTGGNATVSQNGVWPSGITLNAISGAVVVANGTTPGTYLLSYELCDLMTPSTCSTVDDVITITAVINPTTESVTIPSTGGTAVVNVTNNDFVNGLPTILGTGGNAAVSINGVWPAGISLNTVTGSVNVANGTAPGTYSISYQLCDLLTPSHCSIVADIVTVTAVINPITETGSIPSSGGIAIANIASNDFVNGLPAILGTGGNAVVSPSGVWPAGISLDPVTGNISVSNGTTPGTYNISYNLCDLLIPSHCSTVTDIVNVLVACDLSITKTIDNFTPRADDNVEFTLTVVNNSPNNATGVVVTDKLPSGYTYVSDNGAGMYINNTGLWTIGTLASGANAVLKVNATVNFTGIYSNTASVAGTEFDPNLLNNTSSVTPVPIISHGKPIANNDTIAVYQNNSVTFDAMANDVPSIDGGNIWVLVTNPVNGSATMQTDGTFTYVPTANFVGSDQFTYSVTDINGDVSVATVSINVLKLPRLILSSSKPVANNDGTYSWNYTLIVINEAPQVIDSIQVADNLDAIFKTKGCTYEVTSIIGSGSLLSNGLFNGSSLINTLIEGKSFEANKRDSIILAVKVDTHGQTETVKIFNQALLSGKAISSSLNILSDADVSTNQPDLTPTELPEIKTFIPDGFTPNDDSYNDKFVITHSLSTKIDFEVFNRWGNSVYKSHDYQNDWDGKGTGNFLGKDLPSGTYYCVYKIINAITGKVDQNGVKYITLRR